MGLVWVGVEVCAGKKQGKEGGGRKGRPVFAPQQSSHRLCNVSGSRNLPGLGFFMGFQGCESGQVGVIWSFLIEN